jgi:hypothetical protein
MAMDIADDMTNGNSCVLLCAPNMAKTRSDPHNSTAMYNIIPKTTDIVEARTVRLTESFSDLGSMIAGSYLSVKNVAQMETAAMYNERSPKASGVYNRESSGEERKDMTVAIPVPAMRTERFLINFDDKYCLIHCAQF